MDGSYQKRRMLCSTDGSGDELFDDGGIELVSIPAYRLPRAEQSIVLDLVRRTMSQY